MVVKVLKKKITFSIGSSLDSKWIMNSNFEKSRSIFDFRKLNEIAGNGLKI
jgi:hypothetical protein